MSKYTFPVTQYIIETIKENKKASPYQVFKELSKHKKASYQSICRLFYLLERCGIIKLVEIKEDKTKIPKHFYSLVPKEMYKAPDEIRKDKFFSKMTDLEIYDMLSSNPQLIFESYRKRRKYKSFYEGVKRYRERKKIK